MTAIEVIDPATEDAFAEVPDQGPAEARAAVDAAAAALPGWAATAPRERAEVLRRAHERLLAETDRIAELITRENGKPIAEARGEVAYSAEFFRWYAEEAVRLDGRVTTAPAGGGRILTVLQPVGVSYLISPWNFPAAMLARKWAPALAAGCTTISKPAKLTPLTAVAMTELLIGCGAPEGAVQLLTTSDSGAVTDAVMDDPRVRKLSFTGSTEVGRALIKKAADRVQNVSMELGGNAPFLVFASAAHLKGGLDAAIDGAMVAKLRHNGETCTAANRFYVEASIAEEFAERLVARFATLKLGPGIDPSTQLGPLVDSGSREKVEELVQAGVDAGATVATGGNRPGGFPKGYYYEPTVLTGVEAGSPVVAEEIFGPVAPIVPFDSEAQAIEWANQSDLGLAGYVYTGDLQQGLRVAEAIEVGMVGLNKGVVSDPAAPFGGVKQSGIGREGGHEGVLAFCEQKYIATNW